MTKEEITELKSKISKLELPCYMEKETPENAYDMAICDVLVLLDREIILP